ncbi:MAG TPA: RNA methyltransferase [Candidatus Limnocylindrales bacterium]|jgi:hypothetical protein|nr:RNA methyltransferase [Candidatus Limnocylindrales bacterium]
MPDLLVAIVHYPVYDKHGDVVTSAVTNIDVPDIARSCRTYGVSGFYVVTPVQAHRALISRVMQHWEAEEQRDYNPSRNEALSLLRLESDLEGVGIDVERRYGSLPRMFATSAKRHASATSFEDMRRMLESDGPPWLMLLGTGSGLAREVLERCEAILEPIDGYRGPDAGVSGAGAVDSGGGTAAGSPEYNHLSVRAAAAVLLDRLRCPR